MAVNATNDITSELGKLHRLAGANFSRQVECIARRKEFHPLATDKDIFTTGGEQSDDYENLLLAARKVVEFGYKVNQKAIEVLIIKGGKHISVKRVIATRSDFFFTIKKIYER